MESPTSSLDPERAKRFMRRAIDLGRQGMQAGDGGPFGAVIVRLGESDTRIEIAQLRAQVSRLLDRYLGLTVSEVSTASVFNDLVELLGVPQPHVSKHLRVLREVMDLLEAVAVSLGRP